MVRIHTFTVLQIVISFNCIGSGRCSSRHRLFKRLRSMYARACYPDKKNTWIKGNNPDDKIALWMAKLYGNSSEWANSISADGKTIYEIAESTRETDWTHSTESDFIRIAFLKESPKSPYKFVGVFENENMDFLKHSYRRIATKIKLIGDPVTEVQLLDDIR